MSAAVAAAAAAALRRRSSSNSTASDGLYTQYYPSLSLPKMPLRQQPLFSRYETQKRRDWNNFRQYFRTHFPKLSLARCSGENVVEFLSYLDGFGQTKIHAATCSNSGHRYPTDICCDCPTRQPWTSLNALIGRLKVAFVENGGNPVTNPFNAVDVKAYLIDLKDSQS